jgi:hypothetical protein
MVELVDVVDAPPVLLVDDPDAGIEIAGLLVFRA